MPNLTNEVEQETVTEEVIEAAEVEQETTEQQPTSGRTKRVNATIYAPDKGSTVGQIVFDINGVPEKINFSIDFTEVSSDFIYQAALNGMVNRVNSAYSGNTDPEKIAEIVTKELAHFKQGVFVIRGGGNGVKAARVPDVVLAWVEAAGEDVTNKVIVQKYATYWAGLTKAEKAKISGHQDVIEVFERLQNEKRLKRAEEAEAADIVKL